MNTLANVQRECVIYVFPCRKGNLTRSLSLIGRLNQRRDQRELVQQ